MGKPTKEEVQDRGRDARHVINQRQCYATIDELDWLKEHARTMPAGSLAIMIGAGPGVMAAALKDGNPAVGMFVVDIETCDYMIAHLRDFGYEYTDGVVYLIGDSYAVGTRYEGRLADLLIIDGDHSERGVRGDILGWLPHVKPGGYLFIHDYDAAGTWFAEQEQYPGVKIATDQLMRPYVFVGRVGTSVVYRNEPIPVEEREHVGLY